MGTLPRAHRMSLASAQFSRACAPAATRASRRGRRSTVVVRAGVFDVTVSDTKQKFLQAYPYPIPSVWSTITQELLVQGHFAKYNVKSEYNALASLGFVSVFDQLYEGFPSEEEKGKIFSAFFERPRRGPVEDSRGCGNARSVRVVGGWRRRLEDEPDLCVHEGEE